MKSYFDLTQKEFTDLIKSVKNATDNIIINKLIENVLPFLKHKDKPISKDVFNRFIHCCEIICIKNFINERQKITPDKLRSIKEDIYHYAKSIQRNENTIKKLIGLDFEMYNYQLFADVIIDIKVFRYCENEMKRLEITQTFENELKKLNTITEKLDYWKSVIDKHFNEPLTEQFGEYEFTFEQEQAKKKQLVKLFGTNYSLISPLLIPEHIYNEHFENALNEPEFTYWFLKNNAQTYFDIEIKLKRLPEKLKTPFSEKFIKAELKKLTDFEQKAETLLHESKFDIYNDYSFSEYAKEIEYLRIKADYYKTHPLRNVQAIGLNTVVLYAEHIYLKEFLESELNKALPPQQNENSVYQNTDSSIRIKVESAFKFMQHIDPRKNKLILNETDFDKLINWVTYFFENEFIIPKIKTPIQKVNTNKGNVIFTFIKLFKEIHPINTRPDTLFELIKSCFYEYRLDKITNYKKQKEPQYYSELISKNK